jgi:hypothetical protein
MRKGGMERVEGKGFKGKEAREKALSRKGKRGKGC